ncbi:AraC family transcriptional regulator [Kitasatospora herbaricolor]|uniref:GlxA family transcriptional regulator n=1 Tax=Kitasatospora herbaricolor TaxID=68217 RepID=UPI0017480F01|nr:helix-turn-helix domain-containing protein [Kitasatospora herbaricolor]MDQ0307593.1 transcriptional regulator GlxA family with amidase domain [Kitasatospora herbaricolor]GGV16425.1 AraC family transcriptional regulator [Kitasatospora herbaricolor]
MHRIAVVAVPPVTAFDLSIPELVFGAAEVAGGPAYEVLVCAPDPGPVETMGSLRVVVPNGLDVLAGADTVMVTGSGSRADADPRVLTALRAAAGRGARIASICTGAFVLAQAGLLDGRSATTYWVQAGALGHRFPAVRVLPDVLFVEDGPVLTSAGLTAGIDLCLHMVRADHGAAVANAVARLTVVSAVRHGGQEQSVGRPVAAAGGSSLAETRSWALDRLDRPLSSAELAAHAGVSVRTLHRRFLAEAGVSPLQWLLTQRIERARELLESTDLSVEQVAGRSGLGGADSLRRHLVQRVGLTPRAYRAKFARAAGRPS